MPRDVQYQLRGLKGLNEISEEERRKFMLNNADKLKKYASDPLKYGVAAERIYNNQKFRDAFGNESFNALNDGSKEAYDYRNSLLRDKVIADAFTNVFSADKDFNILANLLDTQGMLDLLNSDYMGTVERQKKLAEGINAAKKVQKDFDVAKSSPFLDVIGAGFMESGKTKAGLTPFEQDEDRANKDKEIREKLFADTQERREAEASGATDSIYANILDMDNSGKKSLAQSYDEFDKLASSASPYYSTFKNSKWLKDYSHEDRLKDYAKYQALGAMYGEGVAKSYLDRTIQNRVAEAQDGKWTGNTLKKVAATAWSDFGSNVAVLSHLGESAERLAIWNQGKDPDKLDYSKPIKDSKGRVIGYDYAENTNLLTNPDYWYNVYKYNTFSPSEIKAIEERGGVSEDVNVRAYGHVPDFLSWDTAEESFAQVGNALGEIGWTYLTGAAGKALGFAGKAAMKTMGLSAKAMAKASKVGAITNDLFVGASTGLSGAQLESMGTYEEQLQAGKERIKDQIEHELHDYSRTIDYTSKDAKAAINSYYSQLKKADQRRVATTKGEGTMALPLDDATLMARARQKYANQLLEAKQQELEDLHRKDYEENERVAGKTYMTNFIMDYMKEVPITTGIQKFKIAKGSMKGAFDNTLNKEIVEDAATGGVKRAAKGTRKAETWLTKPIVGVQNFFDKHGVTKELLKQSSGGFADEYLDGLNASFSEGIGNADFENYMNKTYNPENYNATVDTMLGNLLSGMSKGIDGITDRQNLYEGFIGAVSPLVATAANPNAVFHPHDAWNAVVHGTDATGAKLNVGERLSRLLTNPLLNSYADLKKKNRSIDSSIDAINFVVKANKDKLDMASKVLSALGDYSSPVQQIRGNLGENEEAGMTPSLLDSKDQKLYNAFTLIDVLNTLERVDGGTQAKSYKDAVKTLEGLANGTLSKEEMDNEVDEFLASEDNKSLLDEGSEKARKIAAERLQKNAKYFMDMKSKMEKINETFAKSAALKGVDPRVKSMLAYNLVASDDYKARLDNLEKELGVAKTDADKLYTPNLEVQYGTAKARQNAIVSKGKLIDQYQKQQDEVQKSIDKVDEKIKSLKADARRVYDKNIDHNKVKQDLARQEALAKSLRLQWNTLEQSKKTLKAEQSQLEQMAQEDKGNSNVLSEEDILNMDAGDRYEVLSHPERYSEEQQKVVQHTINNLTQKDPTAMTKLKDAATLANRVSDLKEMYSRILNNNPLASTYLDAVEELRLRNTLAMAVQDELDNNSQALDVAYNERESNPQAFKETVLHQQPLVLDAYLEENPDKRDVFQPYLDLLQYGQDAKGVIDNSDFTDEQKKGMIDTLLDMQRNSNSKDDAYRYLEGIVDSKDLDEEVKAAYNKLLTGMEKLGYQRDATIIESRKERKAREEEARRKAEEERQKQEAEKTKQAEKEKQLAEEANAEAARKQADEELEAQANDHTEVVDDNAKPVTSPSKPGTPATEDQMPEKGTPAKVELTKEEEAQLENDKNVVDWDKMPSLLMSKDAEDGSVEAGTVWYGSSKNPKQGTITATRKNDVITFSVGEGNKSYAITLSKDDWTYSEPKLEEGITGTVDKAIGITKGDVEEEIANRPFKATRIFKARDGKWYAEGQFHGKDKDGLVENIDAIVELKEDFNLDDAVDRHIASTEAAYAARGVDTHNSHIVMEGDDVMVKSSSLDEQIEEAKNQEDKPVEASENTTDIDLINTVEEQKEESNATVLSGNAMSEYEIAPLKDDGILKHKKGKDPNDSMNRYYTWMKNAGIKLQNIIDEELGQILLRNPHAKVRFMSVRSRDNVTHDNAMNGSLLLVLDYDNSINKGITSIHNEDNGGVIESGGKKYLIIGTVGYGNQGKARKNGKWRLWNTLFSKDPKIKSNDSPVGYGLVLRGQKDFFDKNPSDRFYVNPNLSTEIVPQSLIPGYRVRQLETDAEPQYRSITEILKDDERNPHGKDLSTLAWGIQEYSKFLVVGTSLDKVMIPRSVERNAGNAFVLIPAGNGKMLPAYLKPLFYNETNDGELKSRVDQLLQDVTSPSYATRLDAVIKLSKIFHLDKDGNTFLLRKTSDEISLVKDGKVFKTFTLGSNFDRNAFMQAISDMNPRVNITANVLQSTTLLKQYDEAGALMTDLAKLNTAGSSYSIYGVDTEGKMIQPTSTSNDAPKTTSDLKETNRTQVIYKGQYYREANGEFTLNGKPVTDNATIVQLRINKRIIDEGLAPIITEGVMDFYRIGAADKPEVIKVNRNTKEAEFLPNEEAHKLLDRLAQEEAEKQRQEAADKVMTGEDADLQEVLDVDLGEDVVKDTQEQEENTSTPEDIPIQEKVETASEEIPTEPIPPTAPASTAKPVGETQTFETLIHNRDYFRKIMGIVRGKWADAPKNPAELKAFLKQKNVEVDSIGVSADAVQAWIKTLENCR